jgi:ABC-type antimicrobial peptide transport system permease subunit
MMQAMRMPMDNIIHPRIGLVPVIGSLFLGAIISAVVSIIPSRQAANMNAVEAIKSI